MTFLLFFFAWIHESMAIDTPNLVCIASDRTNHHRKGVPAIAMPTRIKTLPADLSYQSAVNCLW